MKLRWIHIENYRNLRDVTIYLHETSNYFVGENSVGKSNFLDLMLLLSQGRGFTELDFLEFEKPIRITWEVDLNPQEETYYQDDDDSTVNTVKIQVEQLIQEVYPRLYRCTDTMRRELPLSLLRHMVYIYQRDANTALLPELYMDLEQAMTKIFDEFSETVGCCLMEPGPYLRERDLGPSCYEAVRRIMPILEPDGGHPADSVRIITMVALRVLAELFARSKSRVVSLENSIYITNEGKRILPIFISIDEPEIRLSPYLQRAVLTYYRQIVNNENEGFLFLLKKLFNLDGLDGQLLIVTHATDALMDDYRHIIRFYRTSNGMVRVACGSLFQFPRDVEKHLIMHFPEGKEALYARCVIIVEGETEYGSFRGFGEKLGINFDYFGICLINARGEASIEKLATLFRSFEIPTVVLYDRDVMGKYESKHRDTVFFTDEACFEMDVVRHLLARRGRTTLDAIVKDLSDGGGVVSKEMLRKGLAKLGLNDVRPIPRKLKNISDRQHDDLEVYYFSWFYGNKGVIVGRRMASFMSADDIPPAFAAVIQKAKALALANAHSSQKEEIYDRYTKV